MKISFHGAVQTVTGSKHLLSLNNGKKILLDCGMFQGRGKESDALNRHFGFDPIAVDFVILSHAHIDHSGLIPRLVKEGFNGKIYCTSATYDLCEIMLFDSAHIQESDVQYINKKRERENKSPLSPLYRIEDVRNCLPHFQKVDYNEKIEICKGVELLLTDAGHILGSAVVNLKINDNGVIHNLSFTGDVGRYINKILKHPQPFPQADTLICETTYGNRTHETKELATEKLLQVVNETCVTKKGKLIIPAFSIGKTQELIYKLNVLFNKGLLPKVKIFVDSPLAINATEIMKSHPDCFSKNIRDLMKVDENPFGFNNLFYIREVEYSKAINQLKEPCVIISASGMMDAGRIKHHLKNNIEKKENSILIIGYCEPSTLGGKLLRGDKEVSIFGIKHKVVADIYNIDFFSAHADQFELMTFLECQNPNKVKHVFLVHGNSKAIESMKDRMYSKGYNNIHIPKLHKSYEV